MTVKLNGVGLAHPGGLQALQQLDLNIAAGERVAIIGPSGAGKTSLLRLLGTSLMATSGVVQLFEANPARLKGRDLQQLRIRIGLIHQSPPLPPRQRVVTAVLAGRLGKWSLPRALCSLVYPMDIEGARAALAPLDLTDKLFARCDELSGGQLQRVGIARMLYQGADLLLADEPVSAMDPVLAEHTLALLNDIAQQRAITLVASLHAVDLALQHFPRVVGLRAGRVLFDRRAVDVSPQDLANLYANEGLAARAEAADRQPDEYAASGRSASRCL